MRSEWKRNAGLFVTTSLLIFVVIELVARMLLVPSELSYGRLFGIELPPRVLPSPFLKASSIDRSARYEDLVVNGKEITLGDLWGLMRSDPLLGYAPIENSHSKNDWWQSNGLGARSREETSRAVPPGQKRILVFGDSFAVGSRLPYEETWSVRLARQNDQFEILNFGVDGYGAGQSYLRYQQIRDQINHDYVLFMLAPDLDLWRDINTRRDVGGDWPVYTVMPRFIVQDSELVLVPDPFSGLSSQDFINRSDWDPLLRRHLRAYDRFYFSLQYEEPSIIGASIIYKISANAFSLLQRQQLKKSLFQPDAEAMIVTRSIIRTMRSEVESRGNKFILVLIPTENKLKRPETGSHWQNWESMAENLCEPDIFCIDLAAAMLKIPVDEIDTGYDGTHFGPNSSRLIAELINSDLIAHGLSATALAE
jgi:hypothetical protein